MKTEIKMPQIFIVKERRICATIVERRRHGAVRRYLRYFYGARLYLHYIGSVFKK